jgi:hypothetical protein
MKHDTTPTVVEDFLDEDTEIPGQRYALLSFISPENVLNKKEVMFFEKFLQGYEIEWKIKNLEKFLAETVQSVNTQLDDRIKELEKADQFEQAEICRNNRLKIEDVLTDYEAYIKKQRSEITKTKIQDAFKDFMYAHQNKLEEEFHSANNFQTTMRGLKVRGVCSTAKEAELRAKKLQGKDKYHNIFIGEVGKWLPWDPSPHQIAEQEYAEDQLNTLMKKYKENEDDKEKFFEERTKGAKPTKQIFGANAGAGDDETAPASASEYGSLFSQSGDLALSRKMEKAAITIERVTDDSPAPSE